MNRLPSNRSPRRATNSAPRSSVRLSIDTESKRTSSPMRRAPIAVAASRRLIIGPNARALLRLRAHRSEEHTSELQSRLHLVCRLLLEKKKKKNKQTAENTNTITQ